MTSKLLYLFFILISFGAYAEDKVLVFSYWDEAGPPFVILKDDAQKNISAGILKDIAEAISRSLKVNSKLVKLPVQRIESYLEAGEIDLDCITNPIWKESPDNYLWSPVLFTGGDRLLIKKELESGIASYKDLKGKSLGIYNGYSYHPEIMKMIDSGDITAVKVSGIDHGIKLLLLERIDALIDFDILLNYKIKAEYENELILADLLSETYELSCAYSKKTKFDKSKINKIISELVSSGEIDKILNRYN